MIIITPLRSEVEEIMSSALRKPSTEVLKISVSQRLNEVFHRYDLDNLLFSVIITDRQLTVVPLDKLSELALLTIMGEEVG